MSSLRISKQRKISFFDIISININIRQKFQTKVVKVLIETQLLCIITVEAIFYEKNVIEYSGYMD